MPKPAVKPAPDPKAALLVAIVDEIGEIEKRIPSEVKADISRLESLRKALRSHYDDSPGDQGFNLEGKKFIAQIGERAFQSVVNNTKLFQSIGIKPFVSLAQFSLKSLEGTVEPAVCLAVVTKEQTGTRTLNVVAKA